MLLHGSHKGGASLQRGAVPGMLYWFQLKRTDDNDPNAIRHALELLLTASEAQVHHRSAGSIWPHSTILDMSLKAVLTDSSQIRLFKNGLACLHKTGQGPPRDPCVFTARQQH